MRFNTTKFNNGEFVITNKLSNDGAFGEIYSATLKSDPSKHVVLKVLQFTNEKRKKFFIREAMNIQKLNKEKNIISIDSCYYNDKLGVIVMEKMDCDLLEYIMERQRINERQSKIIFREVCKAVLQCHSNGVSHLDIKPDNILVKLSHNSLSPTLAHTTDVEAIKLADFGFSVDFSKRSENRDYHQQQSNNGVFGFDFHYNQMVGTKEYRPPELLTSSPLNPTTYASDKVDIWGLGITLFAMITGNFPFAEIDGHLVCNDFSMIKRNTKSEKCFDLIMNLLQFNPNQRYNIVQVLNHPWFSEL